MNKLGSFSLVLHSHLPYVLSHGTWPHGTDWLNEAAAETYVPLLNVFGRLIDEGMSPRVTIGLSPVLAEMLVNDSFKSGFKGYLDQKKEAALADIDEFKRLGEDHLVGVAEMWRNLYGGIRKDFVDKYDEDIVGAFRRFQDEGHIEVITCGATHGYFPLLSSDSSINAQVKQAVKSYKRHFGRQPRGMWVPECAYRPSYNWSRPDVGSGEGPGEAFPRKGVEEFLSENGIEYFFVDSHLLRGGEAIGVYLDRFEDLKSLWSNFRDQYQPLPETAERTPYKAYLVGSPEEVTGHRAPVAFFTRDSGTGLQVWSGEWGYPGDGNYLDFHKMRFPGGLKYWRVTSREADLADKLPYSPEDAFARVPENAVHFKDLIKKTLKEYRDNTGEAGVVTSPYDAELFGHWWFEGPEWVYHLIKNLYLDGEVEPVTAAQYLDENMPREVVRLPEGSWGEGGYHWIWFNDMNRWTWKHVYEAEDEMCELAGALLEDAADDSELSDILKQAARELMLLQASDWQFLISTRAASDYAEARIVRHFDDFKRLASMARKKGAGGTLTEGEINFLTLVMERDSLFPDIDPAWFKDAGLAKPVV